MGVTQEFRSHAYDSSNALGSMREEGGRLSHHG